MKRQLILWVYIMLASLTIVSAQEVNLSQIGTKMRLLKASRPTTTLFVHFDKNIYTNNETVWFTGYLVRGDFTEIAKHELISVALIRDIDSVMIKQEKFLLKDGICFGNMLLPDSLVAGNYHFQVTTNVVKKRSPEVIFIQPIIIKTDILPSFKSSIKLLEKGNPNKVLISVLSPQGQLLPKPVDIIYHVGQIHKRDRTNSVGELILSLPDQPDIQDTKLFVTLKYGTDSCFLNLDLPSKEPKAVIKFYPEGGNLIAGVLNRIAWEAKDQQGYMLTSKAILYNKNNNPVDTLETNSYGIGQFQLSPLAGERYYLKLIHSGFAETNYPLPEVLTSGVAISVKQGAAKDSLEVSIGNQYGQQLTLLLHDFTGSYFSKSFFCAGHYSMVIPLINISKGLKAITIFDKDGRPVAERMVFTHYDFPDQVSISTAKEIYGKRDKVVLKIKLNGQDTLALASIACVQENRLSNSIQTDIQSYVYLNELVQLPISVDGRAIRDKEYLENVLLTKGWRRYTWMDLKKISPSDTIGDYDQLKSRLTVLKSGKPIKDPVQIAIFGSAGTKLGTTDAVGGLSLDDKDLVTDYGKEIKVAAIGKGQQRLTIKCIDPYNSLNKAYINRLQVPKPDRPSFVENNNQLILKSNESAIRLKEVKITSRVDRSINYMKGNNSTITNFGGCPYHPYGPGPGEICGYPCGPGTRGLNVYDSSGRSVSPGGGAQLYQEMNGRPFQMALVEDKKEFMTTIPSIYVKKEFYNEPPATSEPFYASTIFWKHGILISPHTQELTFKTSDISGRYRVVLQGITNSDLIYKEQIIEVK